ncbi:Nif3-like dinuclear metal center hexameric protein [Apibacter muscae]|uniref:Nif3-like dinuclear metal center hexameric protein n=1 Tax=Apibacter muscae TaxID=2509004 RepID=UPI0011AD1AB6|nr:Nif3-like dinuclear metal center hexameric protein [Apibacter muscae]TWP27906.1 Nif3-like dinuclear metal center hexameric protein [Apibacter muscae]
MRILDAINVLRNLAPEEYAEDFDNVGVITGDVSNKISGILITLDCLESVVDEAIANQYNLIVTFHPIIFSGLKSITGKNYVERAVIKAIKNNIVIYAIHTNLDIAKEGVNFEICNRLQIKNSKPLIAKKNVIKKLQTYVPLESLNKVQKALFDGGAGEIGKYKKCSFKLEGKGSFLPGEGANPFLGIKKEFNEVKEIMLSVIFQDYKEINVLKALRQSHPYEEISYEIYTLDNENQEIGMGRVGELDQEVSEKDFLKFLKTSLPTLCIRHSEFRNKPVKKIAVLGGSGSFAIQKAIQSSADVFITADLKYHDFFKAEGKIILTDIGHYESEQFTTKLIFRYLNENLNDLRIRISKVKTNPVRYFM